jgi:hypothetical protein
MILARLSRVRRLRRRLLAGAMVGVPLLTSGCGPSVPVQVGMKNVPLDITVGNDVATKPPAPHGPTAPPVAEALPAFAPVITPVSPSLPPPVPSFVPPALGSGSGDTCPQLDPTRASPAAATPEVEGTATDGTWPIRNDGSVSVNGAAVALPAHDTWVTSSATQASQGVFTFAEHGVAFGFPGADAAYRASNSTSAPANPLVSPTSSFGLSRLVVNFPGNSGALVFQPATPLKLLATPAQADAPYQPDPSNPAIPNTTGNWTDTESDAQDGTVMTISASDAGFTRVNACGTPVDAWEVKATITLTGATYSTTAGPQPGRTDVTFTVQYAVATGLGGMIVDEHVDMAPNADGNPPTVGGAPYTAKYGSTLSAPQPEASS